MDPSIGEDEGGEKEEEVLSVEEVLDVRAGSRLSPSYLFSDVRWGYGGKFLCHSFCLFPLLLLADKAEICITATSNKLATACTNGAVILWDLNRDGGSKLGKLFTGSCSR